MLALQTDLLVTTTKTETERGTVNKKETETTWRAPVLEVVTPVIGPTEEEWIETAETVTDRTATATTTESPENEMTGLIITAATETTTTTAATVAATTETMTVVPTKAHPYVVSPECVECAVCAARVACVDAVVVAQMAPALTCTKNVRL